MARWVERDFRAYLRCGILAHSFARARCEDCGQERLVPFSCKGRGVCPSCNARRMAEVAAHLTDDEVASAVLTLFMRALRTTLRRGSPGAPSTAELAAISFPQRFGGSLNAHYHFHVLAVDGVLSESAQEKGRLRFHEATRLTPEDWQRLARTVQRRVLRAFRRCGLLEEDTAADMLT